MRIAFISQPWEAVNPADSGGGSSIPMIIYQLARRLISYQNKVVIYSKKFPPLEEEELDHHGVLHRRIDLSYEDRLMKVLRFLDRIPINIRSKLPLYATPLFYPGYIIRICLHLRQFRPEIIHLFNFSQFVPLIRWLVPNSKIVIHMHCDWLFQLNASTIERRLRKTDLVIGCSNHVTEGVIHRFPQFQDRCKTVYNGADLSQFMFSNELSGLHGKEIVLLSVGRISPEKGMHTLLDAFALVLDHYPEVHLKIVGGVGSAAIKYMVGISDDERVRELAKFYDGPFGKSDFYYNHLLTRLPSDKMSRISFLSPIPHTQITKIYQQADIFINSSLTEAFGLPIIEAMYSGVPVIASNIGGIPELVKHGETGLLFEPGDAKNLAEAILLMLQNSKLRQRLKDNAIRDIQKKFDWEVVTEELFGLYRTMLET